MTEKQTTRQPLLGFTLCTWRRDPPYLLPRLSIESGPTYIDAFMYRGFGIRLQWWRYSFMPAIGVQQRCAVCGKRATAWEQEIRDAEPYYDEDTGRWWKCWEPVPDSQRYTCIKHGYGQCRKSTYTMMGNEA